MLMGEIFTNSIKMVRELVYCMDNLCRKLTSRSFQFVVSVPLGTDFWGNSTGIPKTLSWLSAGLWFWFWFSWWRCLLVSGKFWVRPCTSSYSSAPALFGFSGLKLKRGSCLWGWVAPFMTSTSWSPRSTSRSLLRLLVSFSSTQIFSGATSGLGFGHRCHLLVLVTFVHFLSRRISVPHIPSSFLCLYPCHFRERLCICQGWLFLSPSPYHCVGWSFDGS